MAASEGRTSTGTPRWSFYKSDRQVTRYYFYLWDEGFGPAFVKVCAYRDCQQHASAGDWTTYAANYSRRKPAPRPRHRTRHPGERDAFRQLE